MEELEELTLEGEKIFDKNKSEVKAVPLGSPRLIKHSKAISLEFADEVKKDVPENASAYIVGQDICVQGGTWGCFYPLVYTAGQFYRVSK